MFIHVSSHTQLITRRSAISIEFLSMTASLITKRTSRVVIIDIKFLGTMLCPRCFIEKDEVYMMGTTVDMQHRAKSRVDSTIRQGRVETARKLIFQHGFAVSGKPIDQALGEQSLVPTRVSLSLLFALSTPNFGVECILRKVTAFRSQLLRNVRSRHTP